MFTYDQRVGLAENDIDTLEDMLETMNGRISKLLVAATGILISVVTSCILLALNLVIVGGK